MTVKELIEKLKKFPDDALVRTEGCDCDGAAKDVEPAYPYPFVSLDKTTTVYITRD